MSVCRLGVDIRVRVGCLLVGLVRLGADRFSHRPLQVEIRVVEMVHHVVDIVGNIGDVPAANILGQLLIRTHVWLQIGLRHGEKMRISEEEGEGWGGPREVRSDSVLLFLLFASVDGRDWYLVLIGYRGAIV